MLEVSFGDEGWEVERQGMLKMLRAKKFSATTFFLLRILRVDWRGVWLGVSSSTKTSIDNRRLKKFTEQRLFLNKTRTQAMTLLSHNSHCTHCNEINRQGGEKIFFRLIINQMWKRKSFARATFPISHEDHSCSRHVKEAKTSRTTKKTTWREETALDGKTRKICYKVFVEWPT